MGCLRTRAEIGAWLRDYGESIYGTRGGPFKPGAQYATTRRGSAIYVHVFANAPEEVVLPALPRAIKSASVLKGGDVEWKAEGGGLRLALPGTLRHPIDTVVKLELDGPAMDIAPR